MKNLELNLASSRRVNSTASSSYKILRTEESYRNKDEVEGIYLYTQTSSNSPKYYPPSSPQRDISQHQQIVERISDFFNKDQVSQAISQAKTKADRLKILDVVLKRRDEIKQAETKLRLERAGPMLKTLSQNFKNKHKYVTYNKGSKFKNILQNQELEIEKSETLSKRGSNFSIDLNNFPCYLASPRLSRIALTFDKGDNSEFRRPTFGLGIESPKDDFRNTLQIPKEYYQVRRPSLILEQDSVLTSEPNAGGAPTNSFNDRTLGSVYSFTDAKDRRQSVFYSKDKIIGQFKSIMCRTSTKQESVITPPVETKKPRPVRRFTNKSVFDDASKKLELDLYKHMLYNTPEDKNSLHSMRSGDSPKIKTIESNALTQYKYYQDKQMAGAKSCRKAIKILPLKQGGYGFSEQMKHSQTLRTPRSKLSSRF